MRELDEEIAAKVMGLSREDNSKQKCRCDCRGYTCAKCQYPPHYSTDIAAAWTVVEKLKGFKLDLCFEHDSLWQCVFWNDGIVEASADTAPMAICKASLASVSKE